MTYEVPPPDATTQPWWDATRERRLVLQACGCGHVQHPPGPVCRACGSLETGWAEAAGRGTVDTYTVVHRAPSPDFEPPYVLARVRLSEGPVLLTNLVDCPVGAVACGHPVRLAWRPLTDGRALPVFTLEDD